MNKELTPLEALSNLRDKIVYNAGKYQDCLEWLDIVEKALKALEIILKNYDFKVTKNNNAYWLQHWVKNDCMGQMSITKEEYDLLKEVLL